MAYDATACPGAHGARTRLLGRAVREEVAVHEAPNGRICTRRLCGRSRARAKTCRAAAVSTSSGVPLRRRTEARRTARRLGGLRAVNARRGCIRVGLRAAAADARGAASVTLKTQTSAGTALRRQGGELARSAPADVAAITGRLTLRVCVRRLAPLGAACTSRWHNPMGRRMWQREGGQAARVACLRAHQLVYLVVVKLLRHRAVCKLLVTVHRAIPGPSQAGERG